jgi:hypothetical protein
MTDAPPAARAQAEVMYYPGITIVSGTPAVIVWSADDRIRMWTRPASAPPELVLDAAPSEITVRGRQTVLDLVVGERHHRIDFAAATGLAMRGLGVAGMVASQALTHDLGLRQWVDALRTAGARIRYRSAGASALITVGVVVGVLVVIGAVLALAALN